MIDEPVCAICGRSLAGRRSDAETCGATCRRELSRLRRLMAGESDGRYATVTQWIDRPRRRAQSVTRNVAPLEAASARQTTALDRRYEL